ncbi:MAG: hypothetical protein GKR94_24455 [Gammaproteobacteria bacterium]|nr:hypothetical protein [Gammaproteobacteria bacterium]
MSETTLPPVRCMYLPLSAGGLLVPSSVVAEVIAPLAPSTPENMPDWNMPDWLNGFVQWRAVKLPVLNAERVLGLAAAVAGVRNRVAVLHSVNADCAMAYYAVLIQRLPTVVLAGERTAKAMERTVSAPWVHGQLDLEVGAGYVPNLDSLESLIESAITVH